LRAEYFRPRGLLDHLSELRLAGGRLHRRKGRLATDVGFKDTVLLWPGETVKCAMDFTHAFEGEQLYMFHCHILEHETGMISTSTSWTHEGNAADGGIKAFGSSGIGTSQCGGATQPE
jgi:hypothetical protein